MGKQKTQDKGVRLSALQTTTTLTPAMVTGGVPVNQLGFLPLGEYKGEVRFFDLDLLVNEPLVLAEQLHILGLLDGREEDYDLQTLTIPNAAAIGAQVTSDIEVPSGEVWFISALEMVLPADAGGTPTMNWHCDLWTDRSVTPSTYGQPFHAAAVSFSPGGGTQWDEFTYPGNWWAATNKQCPLRLPAGKKITFVVTNTVAVATAAMTCIGRVYGWIGKKLVE
jgi:hypothetical protein